MKPVGLTDPRTGARPHGVVQLRQDNAAATLYNLVGFQTSLKWPEQNRVLRLIPGLEQAEIIRYGVMHRNIFINAPAALLATFQSNKRSDLFFAGQITGVEGYVESAAAGLMAGINAALIAQSREPVMFPENTAHGALARYLAAADPAAFQPMNINFGLLPKPAGRIRNKQERYQAIARSALETMEEFRRYHV
jgi:methylenetetrahydrofolate--tRNA-(uracil-5-)-methyltransferase